MSTQVRDRIGQAGLFIGYSLLLSRMISAWQASGQVTGVIVAFDMLLVLLLTVSRREASSITSGAGPRVAALVGTWLPLAFHATTPSALGHYAALLALAGLAVNTVGLVSLGRSFGVVAANRGIVQSGLYQRIRHPLYAGYLLSHLALVLTYPDLWNIVVWLLADGALFFRINFEERHLHADPQYRQYQARVPWRLVPGLY
jgi:protein-S-isoprenylcysteine O-methyltransferase Ste14